MSDTTINDRVNGVQNEENYIPPRETVIGVEEDKKHFVTPEFLKAETGEGDVEEYLTHVMNFNQSIGMARVLRGLTGMFGSLNYAIIDVIIGSLDVLKTAKKGQTKNDILPTKGFS